MDLEPSETPVFTWPDRPTCHDQDPFAQRFEPVVWRPAGVRLHPDNDHVPAFRTCSHCGSIHPEDLVNALAAGATMGGSDWKYGWPHKFYMEKIPNTNVGNLVTRSSHSMAGGNEPTPEQRADPNWTWTFDGGRWRGVMRVPDGPTTHGKWYNTHLNDLSDAAFEHVANLLLTHTNIGFKRDGGQLRFWAPRHGYQKA